MTTGPSRLVLDAARREMGLMLARLVVYQGGPCSCCAVQQRDCLSCRPDADQPLACVPLAPVKLKGRRELPWEAIGQL